jgi:hypothetical protein
LESNKKKMEKHKIILENPVQVGTYTLVPIVTISINATGNGIFFSAFKKIKAVVIASQEKVECLAIDGSTIPLSQILVQAPDLNSVLAGFKIFQDG